MAAARRRRLARLCRNAPPNRLESLSDHSEQSFPEETEGGGDLPQAKRRQHHLRRKAEAKGVGSESARLRRSQ